MCLVRDILHCKTGDEEELAGRRCPEGQATSGVLTAVTRIVNPRVYLQRAAPTGRVRAGAVQCVSHEQRPWRSTTSSKSAFSLALRAAQALAYSSEYSRNRSRPTGAKGEPT